MTHPTSGIAPFSVAAMRDHLRGIKKPDLLANRLRELGTSGTAMVLGIREAKVISDGFSGTADAFIRSSAAANN